MKENKEENLNILSAPNLPRAQKGPRQFKFPPSPKPRPLRVPPSYFPPTPGPEPRGVTQPVIQDVGPHPSKILGPTQVPISYPLNS